jgi:flagellar hook protein FlgE
MDSSLSAAVSGIDANQTLLDIIGNNIANTNTTGYKAQSVTFSDLLGGLISGGSAPGVNGGGINPTALGAGVTVSGISTNQAQGSDQTTGAATNVEINGSGYLIVRQNGQNYYTRNGDLSLDANGNLVTSGGAIVQGWSAVKGVVSSGGATGSITISPGQVSTPNPTANAQIGGNLDATATTPQSLSTTAYDASGKAIPVELTFTPPVSPATAWTVQAFANGSTTGMFSTPQSVTFGSDGEISQINGAAPTTVTVNGQQVMQLKTNVASNGISNLSFDLPVAGSAQSLTSRDGNETAQVVSQDGYGSGTLQSFSIGSDGTITGTFSNGESQPLGQLAVAQFANSGGLIDQGSMLYSAGPNSGSPQVGIAGTGGRGTMLGGHLEGSNVDLGDQLTELIVAQSAYEANTKVVTTTATVLQALNQMS